MARFSKTQVAGFLITGAAVGAAIALIWAPKSGEQMRKDIRRLTKKTVNQLDDLQSDAQFGCLPGALDFSSLVGLVNDR